jgi:2-dehydro-3-deoxyphosphogluconate aldolase/(4S)-4-hydroxy-2-oxoglutarate aldolase
MPALFDPALAVSVEKCGIVAVLVIDHENDAVPLSHALLKGGVHVMELTLRTPAALPALRKIKAEVPDMIAGVGTILTPIQVRQAADLGAAFGVSPGLNPRVLAAAREAGLSFAPGIATPSDIEQALEHECQILKFFPAEPSGGLAYLKAMTAPYAHLGLKFVPLGGLTIKNMASYLADPHVAALGGSWLAPRDLIHKHDWSAITALCVEAVQTIRTVRSQTE